MKLILTIAGIFASAVLQAQAPDTFEVASIRLTTPSTAAIRNAIGLIRISDRNVTGSAVSVRDLIFYAYDIKPFQFAEPENWVTMDRYNILAKAAGDHPVTRDQNRQMIRALLAERFELKLKQEKREMSVYSLRVAPNGTKLRRPSDPASLPPRRIPREDGVLQFAEGKMSMLQLLGFLSAYADRPVVDQTGLDGDYIYSIEFAPDRPLTAVEAPAGVSLYQAVQDQLGLKLEATKLPVDYFKIEHVQRPSEN